jgi:hypothetical protein
VDGTGFNSRSQVFFGDAALVTTFASGQLTAEVPASLIALPGRVMVTVQNPDGSVFPAAAFEITPAPGIW